TEIGTIEGPYTYLFWFPIQGFGLSWHYEQLGVLCPNHCETVRYIKILLVVGNVEIYFVTYFYSFNIVRGKVATNHTHINMYFISVALHSCISGCRREIFVFIVFKPIDFL